MNGRADNESVAGESLIEEEVSVSLPPEDVTQAQVLGERMAKPERREGELLAHRYRLERLIAKGGMGRVYLATQLPLERKVAVKVLTAKPDDEEFRKRFFLEASTCAKLVHRHIVTVHDYGEADDGELFMAMEYLDGEPLSRVISQQIRLGSERAAQIGLQVCRALRTAHKTGVVHRDLKPGNVMLIRDEDQDGSDFVKVLDFGLVKVFEKDDEPMGAGSDLTRSGTWLGSPRYMAPEQIRCKPVDPRTDIYSLGIILFNMVAGRPPFVGANSVEILEQHLRDAPPTFEDVMPGVPFAPELEVVIRRCMEKRPDDRYQSMDDLIADLKAAYRLMTGVSVHTESQLSGFSEAGRNTIPPDLSLPPDFSLPPDLSDPSGLIAASPPPLPSSTPVPAAFPSEIPPLDPEPSFVTKRPTNKVAIAVVLLLLLSVVGFAATKVLAPEKPKIVYDPPKPAPPPVVQVRLTTSPAGATVRADEKDGPKLGTTPYVQYVDAAAIGETKSFVLELEGYETQTLTTQLEQKNVDLHAALVPRAKERPKAITQAPVDDDEAIEPDASARSRRVRKKKKSRSTAPEDVTTASVDAVQDDEAATPPAVEDDVSLDVDDGKSIVVDDQASHVVEEDAVPIVD